MNMKNITKTGLNEFIGHKVKHNKASAKQELDMLIDSKLNPVLDVYVDCKSSEKAAQKFVDEMTKALEMYDHVLGSWRYKQSIQYANQYAVNLGKLVRDEIKQEALKHIENPQRGAFDFGNAEINQAVTELMELCTPIYQKIKDNDKLLAELERVIKNEHNGGMAYKSLIALGVDMEGYEEISGNLPAIVKLSVDVCLINGNCEEKSA